MRGGVFLNIEAHAFDPALLLMGLWSIIRLEPSHSYGIQYLLHLLRRASYTNSSHFLLRPIILSRPIPLSLPTFFCRWALLLSFFHTLDSLPALLLHIGLDLPFFLSIRYPFQTNRCTTDGALLFISSGQFSVAEVAPLF